MAIVLTVNGTDRTTKILEGSIGWTNVLNGRDTLRVTFRDHYLTGFIPVDGHAITLTDGGVGVFGGVLTQPQATEDGRYSDLLRYSCQGIDYSAICDKRLVITIYENMTLAAIVADIITNFLDGEGITAGTIETGPTIVKAVFNRVYVTQALNELSTLSGLTWWVDPAKALHFRSRSSVAAATAITDTTINRIMVTPSRTNYRNVQYVEAGLDISDPRTETFKGDGQTSVFPVSLPVASTPTITVNAVTKSVGIRGITADDGTTDWFWNKGTNEISQANAATRLTTTDTLAVLFQGQFPISVVAQDDAEVLARAAIETGTSGKYEAVETRREIEDGDQATDVANGLLRRFGRITKVIDVYTLQSGYRAGQLVTLTNTKHQLSGTFLIESVDAVEMFSDASGNPTLEYHLRILEGEVDGGWLAFFRKLEALGRSFVIRENEVIVLVRPTTEAVTSAESLVPVTGTVETRIDFGLIDFSEVA